MSLTKFASKLFKPRQYELEKHYTQPEALQRRALHYLLEKGKYTE